MSKDVQGIYLLLGANLGKPVETFEKARLMMKPFVSISRTSSLFITAPWKMSSKNLFHNQVLELETDLDPQDLLQKCLEVEIQLGRKRTQAPGYQDRVIDIDILLYGDQVLKEPELIIPQNNLASRAFALLPLLELNPDLVHPETGVPFKESLIPLKDQVASITKLT